MEGGLRYICHNKRCQAGVRTGSHTFSIFLSAMLEEAFRDMGNGIYIQSRPNADLFTVAHYSCTLIFHSAEEIQRIVDAFANASSKLGLKINIKKTEVMFQPNSTMTMEEDINVDETTLNPVKEFTYLDCIIASDGHIDAELQKRMSKASMSFRRLRERLWNNHNVSIRVKGKYTVLSYCPLYCKGLRHGRCIGGM